MSKEIPNGRFLSANHPATSGRRCSYEGVGKILPFILIVSGFCAPRCGATVYHSNGSVANVQQIHDTQAVDGDTITLPAGIFSWTGTVRLTKAIILQGQTVRNDDGTSIDNTKIQDYIPASANAGLIQLLAPGGQRVTGITFVQGLTVTRGNSIISVSGTSPTRIDHCVFDHTYLIPSISVSDYNYGVIDHNTQRNPTYELQGFAEVTMGSESGDHGDSSFMVPAGFGGSNFLFFEDNLITGTIDNTLGTKLVIRRNTFVHGYVASHSTSQSFRDGRSTRATEIYNNTINLPNRYQGVTGTNGGCLLFHDNRIVPVVGNVDGINLSNYRMMYNYGSPFLGADGTSPWDYNATEADGSHVDGHAPFLFASGTLSAASISSVTDSSKNWTANQWAGYSVRRPSDGATASISGNNNNTLFIDQWQSQFSAGNAYEIHKVIRALDQPGLGMQTGAMDRNSPGWMQQATEPCYSWNNVDQNGARVDFNQAGGGETILLGRDYFNNTPMPGYTPYVYPHPLVSGATPTPTATATATSTPTATATATPTATATAPPDPSPTPTPTPTATETPVPTPTATPTATAEPSPTPTATPTATPRQRPQHTRHPHP